MARQRKPPQAKRQPWYSAALSIFDIFSGGSNEAESKEEAKGKVNLLDGAALKRALDDAAAQVLLLWHVRGCFNAVLLKYKWAVSLVTVRNLG